MKIAQFPYFQKLPAEIRHQIWYQSLSELAVWYTTYPHVNLLTQQPHLAIRMKPVGAAPYQAGLSCKESRYLMEKLYTRLVTSSSAVYWLIPDRTIVYLGCPSRATDFLIFHAYENLPLRHLVLHWSDLVDVIRFSQVLAHRCLELQTLILHAADRRTTPDLCRCDSTLCQELADWYAKIVAWQGEKLPYEEHVDAEMLQWTAGEYFVDRDEEFIGPRLHFLPPEIKKATT